MNRQSLGRKIGWTALLLAGVLLVFLISVQFLNPTSVGSPRFVGNANLWAVIWTVNFLLFLVLTFVLARDLVKLFFDYRSREGSRIKSKLITTFVVFSLFPALIMALLAFGLINRNLRLWLTSPSEQVIGSAEQMLEQFYSQNRDFALAAAHDLRESYQEGELTDGVAALADLKSRYRDLTAAVVFTGSGELGWKSGDWLGDRAGWEDLLPGVIAGDPAYRQARFTDLARISPEDETDETYQRADMDLVLAAVPIRDASGGVTGVAAVQFAVPISLEFRAIQVREARDRLEELKAGVVRAEVNYLSILAITTLAVIFGFVWLGTYIARRITVPLEALADGARELAEGNIDYRVDVTAVDELGVLVDSFNRMADEITQNRRQLEKANAELTSSNAQLEERRRYTETILQNIATGVISVDEDGIVRTVNEAAVKLLETSPDRILNRSLQELGQKRLQEEFQTMKQRISVSGVIRRDLTVSLGGRQVFVAATATPNPLPLRDRKEFLVVLDDLTELIRAEKFAAWQEVARRLAHEIKNPLTPIQLSADRIKRRFERLSEAASPEVQEFGQVLDEAVRVINVEAEVLKTLVGEFSRFARLPISQPVAARLHALLDETLESFDFEERQVHLTRKYDPAVDLVLLDREQIRRVFVNLIDNALDALAESNGGKELSILTRLNPPQRAVTIEFSDTGNGISGQDYDKLFLPYFSTKKKGTGLGLAIVRQIITDHRGVIRAQPNVPRGLRILIDLPLGDIA